MHSTSSAEVTAKFDALETALDGVIGLGFDALTTPERFAMLARCERVRRQLPCAEHPLINQIAEQSSREELGGTLVHALADRLLISRGEASRRIHEAPDLGERRATTGEPLPPLLTGTAAGQRAGDLGGEQVSVIRKFLHHLPSWVDAPTRAKAEAHLAELGTQHRPEQLAKLGDRIADCLNPDGNFTDEDRARFRGITLGKQQADGMSALSGYVNPELRATIEAAWAKLAAPGMCNPLQKTPTVDGAPSQDSIDSDTRSTPQRQHDALLAALRALLVSGELGQHNGLPASIIVTTTLADLEAAAGQGLTGGGSLLPMSDVIRLARHAHHYLCIFDKGNAVGLYHTKRLASPGQRIVLYAKDRGCSHPGCDVPGYWCEVHHVVPYATSPQTHVDGLTWGCGQHHPLAGPGGWTTHKRANGDTEWIPPPHLDHGQPRTNIFHHPEKLLHREDGGDDEDEDPHAA
jgi:hypothetical protein